MASKYKRSARRLGPAINVLCSGIDIIIGLPWVFSLCCLVCCGEEMIEIAGIIISVGQVINVATILICYHIFGVLNGIH